MTRASPCIDPCQPARRTVTAATLLAVFGGTAACSTGPSSRLAQGAAPLRCVWVVVSMGSFGSLGPVGLDTRRPGGESSLAMRANFPETLRRNGLQVSGYVELTQPLRSIDGLRLLWNEHKATHKTASHALVLTAQRLRPGRIEYEAVLWDTDTETLVWKAAPSTAIGAVRPRLAEGEALAGDLLRALVRDQFLALANGYPIDARGTEIPREWVPIRLY